ncbi:unnamed protein product, partial [marine sediment metagenome]
HVKVYYERSIKEIFGNIVILHEKNPDFDIFDFVHPPLELNLNKIRTILKKILPVSAELKPFAFNYLFIEKDIVSEKIILLSSKKISGITVQEGLKRPYGNSIMINSEFRKRIKNFYDHEIDIGSKIHVAMADKNSVKRRILTVTSLFSFIELNRTLGLINLMNIEDYRNLFSKNDNPYNLLFLKIPSSNREGDKILTERINNIFRKTGVPCRAVPHTRIFRSVNNLISGFGALINIFIFSVFFIILISIINLMVTLYIETEKDIAVIMALGGGAASGPVLIATEVIILSLTAWIGSVILTLSTIAILFIFRIEITNPVLSALLGQRLIFHPGIADYFTTFLLIIITILFGSIYPLIRSGKIDYNKILKEDN